jgi:hypothetical protein
LGFALGAEANREIGGPRGAEANREIDYSAGFGLVAVLLAGRMPARAGKMPALPWKIDKMRSIKACPDISLGPGWFG